MLSTLKKLTLATAMGTVLLATPMSAQELQDVSEINVTASYEAAEDTNAQALFPEITSDLQLAIAKLVPQSDNAADPVIRVDLRKVALNGDTILPESAEFNQLEGIVAIDKSNGAGGQTFPVKIYAKMSDEPAPEGYVVLSPSLDDFYVAMIDAFAQSVAEGLGQVPEENPSKDATASD